MLAMIPNPQGESVVGQKQLPLQFPELSLPQQGESGFLSKDLSAAGGDSPSTSPGRPLPEHRKKRQRGEGPPVAMGRGDPPRAVGARPAFGGSRTYGLGVQIDPEIASKNGRLASTHLP